MVGSRTVHAAVGRSFALAAACGAGAAVLLPAAVSSAAALAEHPQAASTDAWVATVVLGAGVLAAAWLAACGLLLCVTLVADHRGDRVPAVRRVTDRLTPVAVRRLVAVGLGATLGLTPGAALAAEVDLGWAPTDQPRSTSAVTDIDRRAEPAAAAPAAPAVPAVPGTALAVSAAVATQAPAQARSPSRVEAPGPGPDDTRLVVRAGDSLWDLTDALLRAHTGERPDDAEIARSWPALWTHNLAVIGDDPDLLRPGQVLTVPPVLTTDTSEESR